MLHMQNECIIAERISARQVIRVHIISANMYSYSYVVSVMLQFPVSNSYCIYDRPFFHVHAYAKGGGEREGETV